MISNLSTKIVWSLLNKIVSLIKNEPKCVIENASNVVLSQIKDNTVSIDNNWLSFKLIDLIAIGKYWQSSCDEWFKIWMNNCEIVVTFCGIERKSLLIEKTVSFKNNSVKSDCVLLVKISNVERYLINNWSNSVDSE